LKIETGNR